jgi:hypothetical protein
MAEIKTKFAQMRHQQGITRYWDFFGASEIIRPGEWAFEFWPTADTLAHFNAIMVTKYSPGYVVAPLSADDLVNAGKLKTAKLGTGTTWALTPPFISGEIFKWASGPYEARTTVITSGGGFYKARNTISNSTIEPTQGSAWWEELLKAPVQVTWDGLPRTSDNPQTIAEYIAEYVQQHTAAPVEVNGRYLLEEPTISVTEANRIQSVGGVLKDGTVNYTVPDLLSGIYTLPTEGLFKVVSVALGFTEGVGPAIQFVAQDTPTKNIIRPKIPAGLIWIKDVVLTALGGTVTNLNYITESEARSIFYSKLEIDALLAAMRPQAALMYHEVIQADSNIITTLHPIAKLVTSPMFVLEDKSAAYVTNDYSLSGGKLVITDPFFANGADVTVTYLTGEMPIVGMMADDLLTEARVATDTTFGQNGKLATISQVKQLIAATPAPAPAASDFKPVGENQYGTHPAFGNANELFAFLLASITDANNPTPPAYIFNNPEPASYMQGQFVITAPGTYTFSYQNTTAGQPTVLVDTGGKVRIENANIKGVDNLIQCRYKNTDLEIVNTRGFVTDHVSNDTGDVQRRFLSLDDWYDLTVENCYMENTAGIVIGGTFTGTQAGGQGIKIRYNQAKNISGERRNTSGVNTSGKAQFVQLRGKSTTVRDQNNTIVSWTAQQVPNVEIAYNFIHNQPGLCHVEDVMNFYNFRGTPTSYIKVRYNYIKGAFYKTWQGNDYYGGGILVDSASSETSLPKGHLYHKETCSRYLDIYENHVVLSNNYSIGVAGGNEIIVSQNRAVGKGLIDQEDATRLGLNTDTSKELRGYPNGYYAYDYYGRGATYNVIFDSNSVGVVGENNVSIGPLGWRNDTFSTGGQAPVATVESTNQYLLPGPITRNTENESRIMWDATVKTQPIGVNGQLI